MGAGGRPTKLTPELTKEAKLYAECGWVDQEDVVPSLVGLALFLGVTKKTLNLWKNKIDEEKSETHEVEFLHTLGEIDAKQERVTINNALSGNFNPTISKLLLYNHGYFDKAETKTDVTHRGLFESVANSGNKIGDSE